jgi:hypothetical protein
LIGRLDQLSAMPIVGDLLQLAIDLVAGDLRRLLAHSRRMGVIYNALSLITLLSIFFLAPAIGRAMLTRLHSWQQWSQPIQHLAVGICTMIAVTGMVLAYGALWKLSPKSFAWYTWIEEVPVTGAVDVAGTVDVQQPLRVKVAVISPSRRLS